MHAHRLRAHRSTLHLSIDARFVERCTRIRWPAARPTPRT
jgi:hypothetical protein